MDPVCAGGRAFGQRHAPPAHAEQPLQERAFPHHQKIARLQRDGIKRLQIDRAMIVAIGIGTDHALVADHPHPVIGRPGDGTGDAPDHAAFEIETGHREIRRIGGRKRLVRLVGQGGLGKGSDRADRPEDRAHPCQVIAHMLPCAAHFVFMQIGPWRARARDPCLGLQQVDRVVVEFRIDHAHIAHRPVADRLPQGLHRGAERVRGRTGKPQPLLRGQIGQGMGGLHVGNQRLFRIDMLARLERRAADRVMAFDRGEIGDDFDFGIGQQGGTVGIDVQPVIGPHLCRALLVAVGNASDFQPGMLGDGGHVMVKDITTADHADFHERASGPQSVRARSISSTRAMLSSSVMRGSSVRPLATACITASAS